MDVFNFDDDYFDKYEILDECDKEENTTDRGGQFHLQSAILPVMSQLPTKEPSRFQSKMIHIICSSFNNHDPSYDQVKLFSDYMYYCETSRSEGIPQEIRTMALDVLSRECEVFEMLLNEPDMVKDVTRVVQSCMVNSVYVTHVKMMQKAVYIYNILLSKRLGDDELKSSMIKTITLGKGDINEEKTMVTYSYDDNGWIIVISREIIGWYKEGRLTLTTPSMLLNICDKLQERMNIQMITQIGNRISPSVYPTWQRTREVILWGDNVVRELGNEGYGLLANFESLMISQIIKVEEGGFDNGRFQQNVINDIIEDCLPMLAHIHSLFLLINDMSVFHIAQLHGLYRIWGHPEVDSEAGMRKVGDLLHTSKHADKELEESGRLTFREVFMTNYFKKHGYYPQIWWDLPKPESKESVHQSTYYIKNKVESNLELDIRSIYYDKKGWKYMEFSQIFPLPSGLNIASFLKDKAVSPNRSDLIDMIVNTNRVTDPFKRRGVLKWLSSQPIDIKKFMHAINSNPTGLPKEDSMIGLYPKERELKLQARMFALMSYKMRIYFVMTEEMLSHHVLPYFPQIAMNDNFLEIQKKFVDFTTPMANDNSNSVTYIVNIDFKKWNQQMRKEITLGIFTDLGMMFGLSQLYNRTYDIFMNSFVYLCNGTFTPKVVNGKLSPQYPLSWEGDQGGKEGLRQKAWTIVSAMDLYTLCNDHGFTFKIIGGGDNQVLVITMPCQEGGQTRTHRRMERFLEDMDEKMKRRGLPLKIGETWVSSSLFAYNKYMIYKGVQLPSTLKLASRCFHLSNTDLMTIENMTSTLAVSYQSIVSKDYSCLVGWIFSRLNLSMHISAIWDHHPFLGVPVPTILANKVQLSGIRGETTFKNQLTKKMMYYCVILFPRVLGGSGTINLLSLLSRGFPDGLSEWCSYLYLMEGGKNKEMDFLIKKILSPTKRSTPRYSKLLEDPNCLSLDSAEIGSGALRNIALAFLERTEKISNKGFKQFVQISSKEDVEKIAETLCTGVKIIPRELHDIMGSTIYGYMSSILAKIDKSTTINKLGDGTNILDNIRKTERNWINYCAYRMTVQHGMLREPCPTRTAERWRDESWNKHIIGVTTPHPAAFLRASPGKFHPDCDGNFILHVNLFRKEIDAYHTRAGPCNPYLGSYTREKSLGTELASAYGSESLIQRPIHLQKLIGWRYKSEGGMASVIRACLKSVTDIPGLYFESDPRCITGDAEHRYKDKATKHEGVINNLYYWSSWMRTLTDSFTKHSRGGKNETLQFQSCMLYINALSAMVNEGSSGKLMYFSKLKRKHLGEIHYHECCTQCIVPLENPEEVEIMPRYFPPIPSCPNNPYLYIKGQDMTFSYSDQRDMMEYENTTIIESITDTYDGRDALSLLTGCMMGRRLTGSRHNGERLTESTWRMILGKVSVPVMLNGLVNYLIAWKFYNIMMKGESTWEVESTLEYEINKNSAKIVSFWEMCLSYSRQRQSMQEWCRSNDTGIALCDIECKEITYEIIKRTQINANRMVIHMHKTRGENVNKEERVIRILMGMHYVASECSECQNYLRQYMKNNIAKRCLCPHEELRSSLMTPSLVWPEGIESLSKKVPFYTTKKAIRLPIEGYLFEMYDIHSSVSLANINGRCTQTDAGTLPVVRLLSNFPVMYQICKEMCVDTKEMDTDIIIVDTYDGHLENMLSRYMIPHERVQFKKVFRSTRQEYMLMQSHMSGDEIFYRLEDLLQFCGDSVHLIIECEQLDELLFYWKSDHSFNNVYIFQVHHNDLVRSVKWLCSRSTGINLRMARISESSCVLVLSKYSLNKAYPCVDMTAADSVLEEIRGATTHIQSRRYDSWRITSGTNEQGSLVELFHMLFNRPQVLYYPSFVASWKRLTNMTMKYKRIKEKTTMNDILQKYIRIYSFLVSDQTLVNHVEGRMLSITYPNKIICDTLEEGSEESRRYCNASDVITKIPCQEGIKMLEIVKGDILYMGPTLPNKINTRKRRHNRE